MFVGCYKSTLTNTEHPTEGTVTVHVEVKAVIDGVPDNYVAMMGGETVMFDDDGLAEFSELLKPDTYRVYVYNQPRDISVDGYIASVTTVDGVAESYPEILYFGYDDVEVKADQDVIVKTEVKQKVQELCFKIGITEGEPDRIDDVFASISGVAAQWNCIDDSAVGAPAILESNFTIVTEQTKSTECESYIYGVIRYFGINETAMEQILKLVITYDDGKQQIIESDISEELKKMGDVQSDPIELSGDMSTPIEGEMTGEITNWTQGAGGSVTVN